ncbi:MAG: hypothetical protein AAF922_18090 [Pseudomonadota bacterium]
MLKAPRLTGSCHMLRSGELLLTWYQPLTSVHFKDIDTTFSFETNAAHSIRPTETNSARSVCTRHKRMDRPGGRAAVTSRAQTTSTAQSFQLNGQIEVSQAGDMIFERCWSRKIDRLYSQVNTKRRCS